MVLLLPAVAPVTLVWATVQEKVAPLTGDDNDIPVAAPLQIACDVGVATVAGNGLTVTVSLTGLLVQLFAVAVIV